MNRTVRNMLWAGATAVAVPAAVNAYLASQAEAMPMPLPGDVGYYDWTHGCVAFYRLGQGPPLLLVHSPHAGASSWEWRKVFPELANNYTVYALDLLGFGLSDKPSLPYNGRIYADLAHDFIEDVIGQRADVMGSALGASYLVNVAVRRPELIGSLVLVNPTGVTTSAAGAYAQVSRALVRAPVLSSSLYYAITSRWALERELKTRIYFDPDQVTPDMVDFLYAASHQPGSQYAASAFIAGQLDLPMRMAFSALTQPVLIVWGRDAYYTPVGEAADLLDTREFADRDLRVVVPVILGIVLLVLVALLGAVFGPLVLLTVNALSALAAIGLGSWVGSAALGFAGLDVNVPLLAFMFLVALGVDYTIFLVHRAREEAIEVGTVEGMRRAVGATGTVITSAGVVLAAVFAALGVLPLMVLAQLGLIVGLGVLVDTFVVRSLLVPALFALLGDRMWWPRRR